MRLKLKCFRSIRKAFRKFGPRSSHKKGSSFLNTRFQPVQTSKTNLSENERIIHDFLKALDFPSFLKRSVGGNKTSKAISATLLHCSRFLVWSFRTKFSSTLLPSQGPEWISIIVKKEYLLLDSYCDYLMTTKGHSASTVVNYISSILTAVKWFVVYSSTARAFHLDSTHLFAINTAAKALRKSAAKTAKRDSINKTVEKSWSLFSSPLNGDAIIQILIPGRRGFVGQSMRYYILKYIAKNSLL